MYTKNQVELIGNIGSINIEGEGDNRRAILSIATNEAWKGDDGKKQERTNWTRCVIFRKTTVDFADKYLDKGRYVRVEGSLRTNSYEKDGETRYSTDVIVSDVNPLDSKKPEGEGSE